MSAREQIGSYVMPSSIESEQSVIGGLLSNNQAWDRVCDLLTADMFSRQDHREIFETIRSRIEAGEVADVLTVSESLDASGVLGDTPVLMYLAEMVREVPTAIGIRRYAEIVSEKAALRGLAMAGAKLIELASARSTMPVVDRQAEAVKAVDQVANTAAATHQGTEVSVVDALDAAITKIDERLSRRGALGGLSTGLKALDNLLDGLRPGELIVVGGRPSMGKSCVGELIARRAAKDRKAVRVQSYEMPASDLLTRSAAAEQSIPLEAIRKATMDEDQYNAFTAFVGCSADWNMVIDEDTSATVDRVAMRARNQRRRSGLDLLVVDHLHLIPVRGDNRAQALGDVSAALKRLARELGIPVVLLAQLNRETAKGGGRRPTLSDLRDSGAIEQDADVVVLIHRPGYYDEQANPGEAELIVAKHRNGPTGTAAVGWHGGMVRFQDYPPHDWTPVVRTTAETKEEFL